jgi:hypothetical protein
VILWNALAVIRDSQHCVTVRSIQSRCDISRRSRVADGIVEKVPNQAMQEGIVTPDADLFVSTCHDVDATRLRKNTQRARRFRKQIVEIYELEP